MPYQITPDDERTLDFLVGSNPGGGPLRQFLDMADQRRQYTQPGDLVNNFSMGGQMNPRTMALLTRLAQMRMPRNDSAEASSAGYY